MVKCIIEDIEKNEGAEKHKKVRKDDVIVKSKIKKDFISSSLKQKVWDLNYERSIGFCKACNINPVTINTCHFSHILAERNGGQTNLENLTICCSNCNLAMGIQHLEDFKEKSGFNNKNLTDKLRNKLIEFLIEENKKINNK
jgi:5-methylcytosine-specific restriction endonuclease McrA